MQSSIVIYWVSAVLIVAGCNRPNGVPFTAKYHADLGVYSLSEQSPEGLKMSTWGKNGQLEFVTVSSKTKHEEFSYRDGFLSMSVVTDKVEGIVEEIHYDRDGGWRSKYLAKIDGEKIKDMNKITITDDLYYVKIRDYTTGLEEEISYRNGKKQYSETRPIAPDDVRKQ